jgi:hypothetical protein
MDFSKQRLAQARSFGYETIDLSEGGTPADHIERILGEREVDCAVDCAGFEARGHGGAERHTNSSSIRTGYPTRDLERDMTKSAAGECGMDMCRHASGAPNHRDAPRAPGDRWRLFASVAACGSLAKRQQAANLYAARLLSRRSPALTYTYGAKGWLPVAAANNDRDLEIPSPILR